MTRNAAMPHTARLRPGRWYVRIWNQRLPECFHAWVAPALVLILGLIAVVATYTQPASKTVNCAPGARRRRAYAAARRIDVAARHIRYAPT